MGKAFKMIEEVHCTQDQLPFANIIKIHSDHIFEDV